MDKSRRDFIKELAGKRSLRLLGALVPNVERILEVGRTPTAEAAGLAFGRGRRINRLPFPPIRPPSPGGTESEGKAGQTDAKGQNDQLNQT